MSVCDWALLFCACANDDVPDIYSIGFLLEYSTYFVSSYHILSFFLSVEDKSA